MINNFRRLLSITKQVPGDQMRYEYFKKVIINLMIERGGYYKSLNNYLSSEAIRMFEAVLNIDKKVPIAHYRLGHLYYRKNKYIKSLSHFAESLMLFDHPPQKQIERSYKLDETQIKHANLFIAISGLCLAKEKKDYIKEHTGIYRQLSDQVIESLELDYKRTEFVQYNMAGYKRFISYIERDDLLDRDDLIILYRVDNEMYIQFGERSCYEINLFHFNFIKKLLCAKINNPLMPNVQVTNDTYTGESGQALSNVALRKRIQRLRRDLFSHGIPMEIENGNVNGTNQGYYAVSAYEYYIIEREETFMESFV